MSPTPTTYEPPQTVKELLNDRDAFEMRGAERTQNVTGFMYPKIGESASYWLSSLPNSKKPLLDLGACYGVHTLHAMDRDERHIAELRRRPENVAGGKLVDARVATLPCANVVGKGEFSGVLLSEVYHFLEAGEVERVIKDCYEWLEEGGLFVATGGAWPMRLELLFESGFEPVNGMGIEEMRALLEMPRKCVEVAPGVLKVPKTVFREAVGDKLYLLSMEELTEMARGVGFEVLECRYCRLGKYGVDDSRPESALLVARKGK